MACFSCIHIIANRDNLNQEFFRIKNSIQIAKKNVNCLIKDLNFFQYFEKFHPTQKRSTPQRQNKSNPKGFLHYFDNS